MQIVAGINLNNLHPRVWDAASPYYLSELNAVMVSYADFYQKPGRRRQAMENGLHASLGIPKEVQIYLDNGAFYFSKRGLETPNEEYEAFVKLAQPDWRPIPYDAIPAPKMSQSEQQDCFRRTMDVNYAFQHDGYVPVMHISEVLPEYIHAITSHEKLSAKPSIALGGIVPHLLRTSRSRPYQQILNDLRYVRHRFAGKQIHLFGVGGTATLHVAGLLGINSLDSSGWRARAARGLIQLSGSGDRLVADLGKWRGRELSAEEAETLLGCGCPACLQHGIAGLQADKNFGFHNRATHNLWTLLQEAKWIEEQITAGTYREFYKQRLDNSTYLPLIEQLCNILFAHHDKSPLNLSSS